MDIFKSQNRLEFSERFKTDFDCKEYLSEMKWKDGFKCVKCGHGGSQVRKDLARTCNICRHTESATANTLFHKVKFGVRKAFVICYEIASSSERLSVRYISVRHGIHYSNARLFMQKVRKAMDIFKAQNHLEFSERFKTDFDCREYLSELKWKDGFKCVKCGHGGSQVRKDLARTCNNCSHTESATANTLFHKVKFGVRKAFVICHETASSSERLSVSYMAVRHGVHYNTARLFMHKVRKAMESSGKHPMDGTVVMDELVLVSNLKKER